MKASFLALPLCLLILAGAAAAQEVVISEVLYDPTGADTGQERIEIYNRECTAVDLTGWSICVNNAFPTRFYWAFPSGFTLAAESEVTIHWRQDGTDTPTDLFTGSANSNFLCALGAQDMSNTSGAVALYSAAGCLDFDDATKIVDFVQYGAAGAIRETVAVAAGIWTLGDFVPLVPEGSSIAYDMFGDSSSDYYADATPTLGSYNGPNASLNGTPAAGNPVNFSITDAPPADNGARAVFLLSVSGAGSRFPIAGSGGDFVCLVSDSVTQLGLSLSSFLTTGPISSGAASTPQIPFPQAPPNLTIFFVSVTVDVAGGRFGTTSETLSFVTQ